MPALELYDMASIQDILRNLGLEEFIDAFEAEKVGSVYISLITTAIILLHATSNAVDDVYSLNVLT